MRGVIGLAVLSLLATGCGGCSGGQAVPSPNGSLVLRTRIESSRDDPGAYLCVVFDVVDRSGRVLHSENTRSSSRMRWSMDWVSDDRIRLQSADVGTYEWQKQVDGTWLKVPPRGSSPSVTSVTPPANATPSRP